jgi:hypothetical protein
VSPLGSRGVQRARLASTSSVGLEDRRGDGANDGRQQIDLVALREMLGSLGLGSELED